MIKSKYTLALLITMLFFCITGMNFLQLQELKKNSQLLVKKNSYLVNNIDYLERCIKHLSNIDKHSIPQVLKNGNVIYFSSQSCSSCVEKLLHKFGENKMARENVVILANDSAKVNFIDNINDAYQYNFRYLNDSLRFFQSTENVILLLKMKDGQIRCILEYSPENDDMFEKYFSVLD